MFASLIQYGTAWLPRNGTERRSYRLQDEIEQWTVVLPEKLPAGKAANNGAKRRRVQDQGECRC